MDFTINEKTIKILVLMAVNLQVLVHFYRAAVKIHFS